MKRLTPYLIMIVFAFCITLTSCMQNSDTIILDSKTSESQDSFIDNGTDNGINTDIVTDSGTCTDSSSTTSTQAQNPVTMPTDSTDITMTSESEDIPDDNIPESFYETEILRGTQLYVPEKYNDGITYDIEPYFSGSNIYLFLPSRADLTKLVYCVKDSSGKTQSGRIVNFEDSKTEDARTVIINNRKYKIIAMQSTCPTLYLQIDESYGTISAMRSDRSKNTSVYGDMSLESTDEIALARGWNTIYKSEENDDTSPCTISMKGRGNWSWLNTPKQGFQIKLETKTDILAMGKAKKWLLIANVTDNTLLRNLAAFEIAKNVGLEYTASAQSVDVFVNGEYYGSYILCEKVEINETRVNISDLEKETEALDPEKLNGKQKTEELPNGLVIKYWSGVENPDDITGGYIIEMEMADRYQNEASGFMTSRSHYFVIKSPEYASREQVKYIGTFVQEFEEALYDNTGYNSLGKYYTDYIDFDSFIKKYWMEELVKNHDSAKTSQYFYKPEDSQSPLLFSGPVWDYDIGFGISKDASDMAGDTSVPEGWYTRNKNWYRECVEHEDFCKRANEIYKELFAPAIDNLLSVTIDNMAAAVADSAEMNFILWKDQFRYRTYLDSVNELKSFIRTRNTWILQNLE